jgi:hypothetical protein
VTFRSPILNTAHRFARIGDFWHLAASGVGFCTDWRFEWLENRRRYWACRVSPAPSLSGAGEFWLRLPSTHHPIAWPMGILLLMIIVLVLCSFIRS